jgi:fructosamine-3-kinase
VSSPFVAGVESLLGVDAVSVRSVGGGCISDARRIALADGRVVFAKSGAGLPEGLLAIEAEGLRWLRAADAVRVPEVVALGSAGGADILVLEWVEPGVARSTTAERLGRNLAQLHVTGAPGFGWHQDGFIGPLPQRNTPIVPSEAEAAWSRFWLTRRIEPLARMAHNRGSLPPGAAALVPRLGEKLPERIGPPEAPARLHGDLWSGNVMTDRDGQPWIVDPAPYGGHREVDLAMLHLFGRPAPATIDAYQEVWPLAACWRERLSLWQLEPLLVHAVLFGASYGSQAHDVLRRFA